MRTAKLSISADIGGLKKAVDQAKKQVEGLSKIKMSPDAAKGFQKIFGDKLDKQLKSAETKLVGLQKRIEQVGKGSLMDERKLSEALAGVDKLKAAIADLKKKKEDVAKIGMGGKNSAGGGADAPGGIMNQISGVAKTLGLAVGAIAVYNRRLGMAKDRVAIREQGGSSSSGTEVSSLGFTPEERRGRMLETQRSMGRRLSASELGGMTDMGEKVQRAYGISGEQSTSAFTATRKNLGMGNEQKYLSNTIGTAVAAKLTGSRIGEFLAESTAALEDMSKNGVGIDSESLNGFAAALSTLPFFKSDPSKAFEAIKGLNEGFSHGDRFQQAQAAQAIQGASGGGLSPSAVETRRSMGLFAKISPETSGLLNDIGAKGTARSFKGGPGGVISNLFKGAVGGSKGMGGDERLMEVMSRLNLHGEGGMQIAGKAIKAGGLEGSGIDMKKLSEAQMSPEERLDETMKNTDGSLLKLNATMESSFDKGVDGLTKGIIDLTGAIHEWMDKQFGKGASSSVGGAAVAVGSLALAASSPLIRGASKGLSRGGLAMSRGAIGGLAGVAEKVGVKGAAKMGSRVAEAIPLLGTLVAAGFTAHDVYTIGDKMVSGKKASTKDWTRLTGDAMSLVPGAGLAGAAVSAGSEFMSDDTDEKSPSGATGENTSATQENTAAMRDLTNALGSTAGSKPGMSQPSTGYGGVGKGTGLGGY